jgi:hypothetical protein
MVVLIFGKYVSIVGGPKGVILNDITATSPKKQAAASQTILIVLNADCGLRLFLLS